MIGLDTNILLRFILQDDKAQAIRSARLIESTCTVDEPGYVSLVTVAEIAWVLDRVYRFPALEISVALEALLQAETLVLQNQDEVYHAIVALKSGQASFPDALIGQLNQWAGCATTLTFDVKASRLPGFTLI